MGSIPILSFPDLPKSPRQTSNMTAESLRIAQRKNLVLNSGNLIGVKRLYCWVRVNPAIMNSDGAYLDVWGIELLRRADSHIHLDGILTVHRPGLMTSPKPMFTCIGMRALASVARNRTRTPS